MEKQKKIYLALTISFGLLFTANLILHLVKVYAWWLFGLLFIAFSILLCLCCFLLVKTHKKLKQKNKEQENVQSTGNYIEDLYTVLGIPVQYNKDGSIKDLYDLLGIEPVYDEKGNRVLTIYELLGLMPKFNDKGEELPTVSVIKNRVGRVAKVDLSNRVLTRKLTDEEKEMIAMRELLTQKLKEAEKQGDAQKINAIKKVINSNNNNKGKKEEAPPVLSAVIYKADGKTGKGVKNMALTSYLDKGDKKSKSKGSSNSSNADTKNGASENKDKEKQAEIKKEPVTQQNVDDNATKSSRSSSCIYAVIEEMEI